MNNSVIGMDIAKQVFHVVELNQAGKIIMKRKLWRNQVLNWFAGRIWAHPQSGDYCAQESDPRAIGRWRERLNRSVP